MADRRDALLLPLPSQTPTTILVTHPAPDFTSAVVRPAGWQKGNEGMDATTQGVANDLRRNAAQLSPTR